MHTSVKKLVVNASHLWASNALIMVLRLLYVVVLTRAFGPDLYGLYAYALAWAMMLLPMTTFGLGVVLPREAGRDGVDRRAIVSRSLTVASLFTATTVVFGIAIGWWLNGSPQESTLILLFCLALIGRGMDAWCTHTFTAFESTRHALRQTIVFRPLEVIIGLLVIAMGGDVVGIAIVHLVSWWAQAIVGVSIVNRQLPGTLEIRSDWRGVVSQIRASAVVGIGIFFQAWLIQAPILFFRHWSSNAEQLGQLALAVQLLIIVSTIPLSLGGAVIPMLSRSADRGDGRDRIYLSIMLRSCIIGGAFVALAGLFVGPYVMPWIFGPSFAVAGDLLGAALWLLIPMGISTAATGLLSARRTDTVLAVSALLGVSVVAVTMAEFIAIWGANGAILSSALGISVTAGARLVKVIATERIDVGRSLVFPVLCVIAASGAFLLLRDVSDLVAILAAIVTLVLALAVSGVVGRTARAGVVDFAARYFRSG